MLAPYFFPLPRSGPHSFFILEPPLLSCAIFGRMRLLS